MMVRVFLIGLFLFGHWPKGGYLSGEQKPVMLMKKMIYPTKVNYPMIAQVSSYAESAAPFADWERNKLCMSYVNRSLDSLSIEQKVAQCFMLACYTSGVSKNMDYVERMVQQGKCGGLLFFKGDPTAQAYWTDRLQQQSKIQLLVAIDGEWGLSMRLDSTTTFPRQLTLGAISDNQWIYKMGQEIGRQCREVGVNVNFAPVSDVNNNPNNPVINDRSFGEDKMRVALKALEYGMGMQNEKVLACAKHFPGHGDTDKDSHYGIPVINKTLSQLDALELFPFKVLFTNGIGSTMSAHLSLPQLDKTGIPASLSQEITTNLLKNSLNFKGLVFTDALNMKGASTAVSGRNVDSIAFVAGNDVLEYSENPERGINQISKAIISGDLPMEMLDEKVKKVLAYKYLLGLEEYHALSTQDLTERLNPPAANVLRQQLFDKAMTIVASEDGILPLQQNFRDIATVAIDNKGVSNFQKHIDTYLENTAYFFENENQQQYDSQLEKIANHDLVIIGVHGMSRYASKNYGLSTTTISFIHELNKRTKVILVLFGSPYSLKFFDEEKNVLVAYEENEATQLAAANAVLGGISVTGKLPVTASAKYKVGVGKQQENTFRMRIATPEDVNLKTEDIREIDEVVLNGLIARAYPGCQVVVIKNNQLIWNKSYGRMTYEDNQKSTTASLYDLASITKIAATTLAVMKLNEEQRLDLNSTVGDYLSLPENNTIAKLKIADILTHHAGLKAYLEFYSNTLDTNRTKYYRTASETGFSVPVARDLYMRDDYPDTIWNIMATYPINPNPSYNYSDFDFYILQKIVEYITEQPLDEYVKQTFYAPMGLNRTCFKPTNQFPLSKIAPTENDQRFRQQLIQGFVHDPGAAMYGGVAGHAGLFSNAVDLAQIMQLFLNNGTYNGKQFLKPETIALFTKQYNTRSRRGLGFDKPEPDTRKGSPCYDGTPLATFGHTGFTGTAVWSDPENDLTVVFLSNRVYPVADNPKLVKMGIRTDIQKIIYKAIAKAQIDN